MTRHFQHELDFGARSSGGVEQWRREQERQQHELARQLNLPLGKKVEVWLHGGVRLRGTLRLADAMLLQVKPTLENTRFEVDSVRFAYAEVESFNQIGAQD